MEGFKKIEDYSSLKSLEALEQLVIWGPVLGFTPIKDLEFLREMPNLRSISIGNVRLKRKYTKEEIGNYIRICQIFILSIIVFFHDPYVV